MKIKLLLISIFVVVSQNLLSQSTAGDSKFFAQGMFPVEDLNVVKTVEADLRALPFVEVVRLDHYSGRFFLLTSPSLSALSEADLRSWFGTLSEKISCLQIGVHGIDQVASFPFENCSEK